MKITLLLGLAFGFEAQITWDELLFLAFFSTIVKMRFCLVFDTPRVDASSEAFFTGNDNVIGFGIGYLNILAALSTRVPCKRLNAAPMWTVPRDCASRFCPDSMRMKSVQSCNQCLSGEFSPAKHKRLHSFLNGAFYFNAATTYSPTHFRVQYNRPCGA